MFIESTELRELGREVIAENKEFNHISGLKIRYLVSDKQRKRAGMTVFADTTKVSDKDKAVSGVDFIITFYADATVLRPDKQRLIMYHELRHVGYDAEKEKCYIIPHDVEDFRSIIEEKGIDWIRR